MRFVRPKSKGQKYHILKFFSSKTFQYANVFGGWVEDKNISLVYHYHDVPEDWQNRVAFEVSNIVREYGFNPMPAIEAIEIKPPVTWTKGHAAVLILNEFFGSSWQKDHRVFYMGDDTSDEAVMEVSFSCVLWFLLSPFLLDIDDNYHHFRISDAKRRSDHISNYGRS